MKDLGRQGVAKERVEKDKSKFGGQELKGKTLAVIGLGECMMCEKRFYVVSARFGVRDDLICAPFLTSLCLGHIGSSTARDAAELGMSLKGE
jgi:D-3-phosphoglycerate dehydrogenase